MDAFYHFYAVPCSKKQRSIKGGKIYYPNSREGFISHQAISKSMQQLENEWRVKLINRSKIGVTLTTEGKIAVQKADDVLTACKNLEDSLKPFSLAQADRINGPLTIYAIPRIIDVILPVLLPKFSHLYPAVAIQVKNISYEKILAQTSFDSVDIAIITLHKLTIEDEAFQELLLANDLQVNYLGAEGIFLCMNKASVWAEMDTIT